MCKWKQFLITALCLCLTVTAYAEVSIVSSGGALIGESNLLEHVYQIDGIGGDYLVVGVCAEFGVGYTSMTFDDEEMELLHEVTGTGHVHVFGLHTTKGSGILKGTLTQCWGSNIVGWATLNDVNDVALRAVAGSSEVSTQHILEFDGEAKGGDNQLSQYEMRKLHPVLSQVKANVAGCRERQTSTTQQS